MLSVRLGRRDRDVRCSRSPQHTRALYRAVGHYLHTYFKAKYLAFCPLTELTMGEGENVHFLHFTDLLEETTPTFTVVESSETRD